MSHWLVLVVILEVLHLAIALPVGADDARCAAPASGPAAVEAPVSRIRTVVTTDGENDDFCSMIRFLLYTDEWDTEAMVYSSSIHHWAGDADHPPKGWRGTEWMHQQLDASSSQDPDGNALRHRWWVYRWASQLPQLPPSQFGFSARMGLAGQGHLSAPVIRPFPLIRPFPPGHRPIVRPDHASHLRGAVSLFQQLDRLPPTLLQFNRRSFGSHTKNIGKNHQIALTMRGSIACGNTGRGAMLPADQALRLHPDPMPFYDCP